MTLLEPKRCCQCRRADSNDDYLNIFGSALLSLQKLPYSSFLISFILSACGREWDRNAALHKADDICCYLIAIEAQCCTSGLALNGIGFRCLGSVGHDSSDEWTSVLEHSPSWLVAHEIRQHCR
jgi:hypothetical protein